LEAHTPHGKILVDECFPVYLEHMVRYTRLLILIGLILFFKALSGQSYGLSAGLRLGNGNERTIGLTGQYRLADHLTIEGIVQTDFSNEHTAHLLLQEHQPFLTKRFNLYMGTGISFGTERSRLVDPVTSVEGYTVGNSTIGVDLMLGMEVTLLSYSVSMDVKPNVNIVGREPWVENQVGISVRSVIISGAKQNKAKRKRERNQRQKARQKRRESREPWLGEWYQELFKKT
jgi:hypothetical protein